MDSSNKNIPLVSLSEDDWTNRIRPLLVRVLLCQESQQRSESESELESELSKSQWQLLDLVKSLVLAYHQDHLLEPVVSFLSSHTQEYVEQEPVRQLAKRIGPLLQQIAVLDAELPKKKKDRDIGIGGLCGYLRTAQTLLRASRLGSNPLEQYTPSVPGKQPPQQQSQESSSRQQKKQQQPPPPPMTTNHNVWLEWSTSEFDQFEAVGQSELGHTGFVLVAGGLGERLGYSNIKVGLPTETTTHTCYLDYYIHYILAVQTRYAIESKGKNNTHTKHKLPLCIMTSADTHVRTEQLLKRNRYFGMDADQVTLLQQGSGVPALVDDNARIQVVQVPHDGNGDNADDDGDDCYYKIVTKPHGHGDVHALLHNHGVAEHWHSQLHLKWLVLFQDTNALACTALSTVIGVSQAQNLLMNSVAIPRKAKQAIGGIATLTHKETGQQITMNVEYNQLDPLLRTTSEFPDGDVNDPDTGFSPFPGNINQLVFAIPDYVKVLQRTHGIMPEFVNPKYKKGESSSFVKPTRLECMMQDFPHVLTIEESQRTGVTTLRPELCFSPVKNAARPSGVELQRMGVHPGTAATGEADFYTAPRLLLQGLGVHILEAAPESYLGIMISAPGPALVLHPSFVACPSEYRTRFPCPQNIRISARSTLVVKGSNVIIEKLTLDGALIIHGASTDDTDVDEKPLVILEEQPIVNRGHVRVRVSKEEEDDENVDEVIRMRGYRIQVLEERVIKRQ